MPYIQYIKYLHKICSIYMHSCMYMHINKYNLELHFNNSVQRNNYKQTLSVRFLLKVNHEIKQLSLMNSMPMAATLNESYFP